MRKIEEEMINAIEVAKSKSSHYWKKDNTMVHRGLFAGDIDITFVYLFGNNIAKLYRNFNNQLVKMEINNCGRKSPTTKSRLNVLLGKYTTGTYIYQKKGEWYIEDEVTTIEFPWNKWHDPLIPSIRR